jgi:hypothetical protein
MPDGSFGEVALDEYKGKFLVLLFYVSGRWRGKVG